MTLTRAFSGEIGRAFGSRGGTTLPRAGLVWYVPNGVDTIGLSANALWDALPSYMRYHYLSDRDTKLPDATIAANVADSGFLNVGGGLHGDATKGYAQLSAAASEADNQRVADYYREDYGWPTDIKSLVIASGGELASPIGPTVAYSAAAGNVPDGFGGVKTSGPPVHSAGYHGGPAYTNLVQNSMFEGGVSGSPGTAPTNWIYGTAAESYTYTGTTVRLTRLTVAGRGILQSSNITWSANTTYTLSVDLQIHELLSGGKQAQDFALFTGVPAGASVSYFVNGVAVNATDELSVGSVALVVKMAVAATSGVGAIRIGLCLTNTGQADVTVCCPQVVASTYIFPYISSGAGATTSVVSTIGTTTGNGVSVPLTGSDAATALAGINTVVSRITCGASSAEITATHNIITVNDTAAGLMFLDSGGVLKSTDGTNTATATISGGFARGDVLLCFEQVNAAGDQFRVGYEKNASGTITWGSWATYDGSFNPGTNLRALLNNSAPTHWSGYEICSGSLSDANCLLRGRLLS